MLLSPKSDMFKILDILQILDTLMQRNSQAYKVNICMRIRYCKGYLGYRKYFPNFLEFPKKKYKYA